MEKKAEESKDLAPQSVKKVNRELASIGVSMNKETQAQLLGPTRTMALKGAKQGAKAAGSTVN